MLSTTVRTWKPHAWHGVSGSAPWADSGGAWRYVLRVWSRAAVRLFKGNSSVDEASPRETVGHSRDTGDTRRRGSPRTLLDGNRDVGDVRRHRELAQQRVANELFLLPVVSFLPLRRCKSVTSVSKRSSPSTPSQTLMLAPFPCAAWKRILGRILPRKGPSSANASQAPPHRLVILAHITLRRTA